MQGCRDPLVVWEETESEPPIILDGHNRHDICTRHKLPFSVVHADGVRTREQAIVWMGQNQLGRRNMDASRKAAFAVELEKQLAVEAKKVKLANLKRGSKKPEPEKIPGRGKGDSRDRVAELTGVNPHYITDAKTIQEKAP